MFGASRQKFTFWRFTPKNPSSGGLPTLPTTPSLGWGSADLPNHPPTQSPTQVTELLKKENSGPLPKGSIFFSNGDLRRGRRRMLDAHPNHRRHHSHLEVRKFFIQGEGEERWQPPGGEGQVGCRATRRVPLPAGSAAAGGQDQRGTGPGSRSTRW